MTEYSKYIKEKLQALRDSYNHQYGTDTYTINLYETMLSQLIDQLPTDEQNELLDKLEQLTRTINVD